MTVAALLSSAAVGAIIASLADPDHPVSRGKLCSKCAVAYNGVWQDPQARLMTPLKRVGARGGDAFQAISWDEALSIVAERMQAAIRDHGAASILHTHYSGTLSLIGFLFPNRLFNFLGASEVDPDSICNAAGHVAWHLQFGNSIMGFDPRTAKDAALYSRLGRQSFALRPACARALATRIARKDRCYRSNS